jgi:CRP-like cAMP-binding protein
VYEVFQQYLDSRISLTEEEKEQIRSVSVVKKLRKKQYLLQEGDVWRYNAFITKGCMRTYLVDEKGIEHITYFGIENWWIGDRESLLTQQPSRMNIDAIEDSEVVLITAQNFDALSAQIPAFKDMVHAIISKSLNVNQGRILSNISSTAEEKYLDFINKHPQFAVRIPLSMIASYLGIKPETLSRVRNHTAKK